MRSMTGCGCAKGEDPALGIGFRVEFSSINRKQFELKFALPREITAYESSLRMIAAERISRGSVTLRVEIVGSSTESNGVNLVLARRLARIANELKTSCGFSTAEEALRLLSLPGVVEDSSGEYLSSEVETLLLRVTREALDNLITMRSAEGSRLCGDMTERIAFLEKTLAEIEPMVKELPKQQYERLLSRARENGFETEAGDERFLRELVIFTDKSDVTEEIIRLHSHFTHFRELLANTSDAVGRTLDFLTQEVFREVNTLGNKAPIPEVSRRIVAMKTEVEKIREQVQNVE